MGDPIPPRSDLPAILVALCLCALASPVSAQQDLDAPDDGAEDEDFALRPFEPQRADNILLDSVVRPDTFWIQAHLGGALYEPRRDIFIGRWSPSLQAGYRFDSYGFFGMLEYDQTIDFTLETDSLHVLNVGIGGEFLNFVGHVRSSLSVGATVLMSSTAIDEPGELGWFIDLRPGALRWGIGEDYAFELTPLSLDIIVPVTEGIPLVVYSYMTILGMEWAL